MHDDSSRVIKVTVRQSKLRTWSEKEEVSHQSQNGDPAVG